MHTLAFKINLLSQVPISSKNSYQFRVHYICDCRKVNENVVSCHRKQAPVQLCVIIAIHGEPAGALKAHQEYLKHSVKQGVQ